MDEAAQHGGGQEALLRFDDAVFSGDERGGPPDGVRFDFALPAGGAAMILVGEFAPHALADAAMGLDPPVRGRVLFDGIDWAACSPREAAARRGRIGRVFAGAAWLSNLDLDENLLLAAAHHRRQAPERLRGVAEAWSRRFGFDRLPAVRPAWLDRSTSQRAQWLRALLAEPDLVVLERPTDGVAPAEAAALNEALLACRARGGAVLWLTANRALWENNGLQAPLKGVLEAGGIRWEEAAGLGRNA